MNFNIFLSQMQWIFYHNQSKANAFHWDLDTKVVQNSITLHPIKTSAYMYRVHAHFLTQKMLAVQHISGTKSNNLRNVRKLQAASLSRTEVINLRSNKDLHRNVPLNATSHWELFSPSTLYSVQSSSTLPVKYSIKRNINLILRRTLAKINLEARKVVSRELLLSRVNVGYMRLAPTKGLQYLFDFRMVMYQHIGFNRRKLPVNVQYQAHVQQPFGNLVYTSQTINKSKLPSVNIILPLAGRLEAFKRFLANFERIVLIPKENVRLLIMYFPNVQSSKEHKNILENYRKKYSNFDVLWKTIEGRFSRGLALHLGAAQFNPGSLLFFCDVDLAFDVEFLYRCRVNTVKGKRVYYPMVFSQFNQTISLKKIHRESEGHMKRHGRIENLRSDHGFWRRYGFGIVCVYGDDVTNVGGFDLTINGWGLEDVRLYEGFLATGKYDVVRTPDPGVVHMYHVSDCSPDLKTSQLQSCQKSALSQFAYAGSLVDYMTNKGYL